MYKQCIFIPIIYEFLLYKHCFPYTFENATKWQIVMVLNRLDILI